MTAKHNPSTAGTHVLAHTVREAMLGFLFVGLLIYSMTLHVQSASAAAGQIFKMRTSGGGSTYYVGRCFRVNFYAQTDSMDVNSADLVVPYSSAKLEPHSNSSCTSVATSLLTDSLFPNYPGAGNVIEDSMLKLTGVDSSGDSPVNTGAAPTDSLFAHIFFKVLSTSGSSPLNFSFTLASTTDTNMAQDGGDGTDALDSVDNLTLALMADTNAPYFSSLSPAASATGVSITANLSFVVTDSGAGINSSTVRGKLSGSTLSVSTSGCSTTDSNRVSSCNGSADLGTMNYNANYTVTLTGGDLASTTNTGSQTWTFATEDDDDAPYVDGQSPAENASGVSTGTTIVFHIKDYKDQAGSVAGLGVDLSTVQVTVTGAGITTATYSSGDAEFGSSGTSADYTITITPATDFPENTYVHATITGSDLHIPPNEMTAEKYHFRTVDSQGPQFTNFSPAQSATSVSADTNISFTVSDVGAGIDISNTTVTVEGTAYTSASPAFSYTGTSSSYSITVNPASNYSGGQEIDVSILTRDLASPTANTGSTSYSFVIANTCTTCSVDGEDPARFTTTATTDDTVVFHVKDTGDGINQNTISATITGSGNAVPVSPVTYTGASAEMAITGTAADYTVTITLPAAISEDIAYSVSISASDVNGLAMSTVSYTFWYDSDDGAVASVCPACPSCDSGDSGGGGGHRGGGGGTAGRIISALRAQDIPIIVARRRLPGYEDPIERMLSAEIARSIEKCYIDEEEVHAAAPLTHYEDIEPGAWYEEALAAFLADGILDVSQKHFRPEDPAQRAEAAKLLTLIDGRETAEPLIPSFDDVPTQEWYYRFIETAAEKGWVKGDRDCYGSHPCSARPDGRITRAEAVAMIVRFFGLPLLSSAPQFTDNAEGTWYATYVHTAADHCILKKENGSALTFPNRTINRAELAVMLYRARQNLQYGRDCTWGGTTPGPSAFRDDGGEDTRLAASLLSPRDSAPSSPNAAVSVLLGLLAMIGFLLVALYSFGRRRWGLVT
ncbi:MAG TPA: S-layer homology domain-containing protein [Candidatus Peribacteraceae bacterium]|nr:S-layer homology domain-containing protein [Candidatus Peribacteraceae bacterium]